MGTSETSIINTVKAWALPGIFAFAVGMLNMNLQEMKQDIKTLLAQSERDQVKIDYLEKEVQLLRTKLDQMVHNEAPIKNNDDDYPPLYAVIPKHTSDSSRFVPNNQL